MHRSLDVCRRVEEQNHVREVPPPVRDARTVLGLVARFEGSEIGRDGADARGLLEEVREEEFWGTALSLSSVAS